MLTYKGRIAAVDREVTNETAGGSSGRMQLVEWSYGVMRHRRLEARALLKRSVMSKKNGNGREHASCSLRSIVADKLIIRSSNAVVQA